MAPIINKVMELQLLIVLIIAFLVLGPERMMDLAVKLGEMMRKIREMWDEIKLQSYMEEINKKVMEEETVELDERTVDETEDEFEEEGDYTESLTEEGKEDEHPGAGTPHDVPHRTPEGTEGKTT